jgi:hypothetical protein
MENLKNKLGYNLSRETLPNLPVKVVGYMRWESGAF